MERLPLDSFFNTKSPIQKENLEAIEVKIIRGPKGEKGEQGLSGKNGIPGKDGKQGLKGEIGFAGLDGKDGKNGESGINGKDGRDGKDGSPDTPKEIIEKINKSRGEKIKASKVEGFEEIDGLARSANRNVQNILSLGGNRQTIIQSGGQTISTGATTINFIGATVAVSPTNDGSTVNVTVSGSSGSGFQQPTSGAINGSNQTFIFALPPNAISVDQGRVMQKVSSDGTINWTGTTTVVLTIAPTFDVFGVN